jgi:hypothetical protein
MDTILLRKSQRDQYLGPSSSLIGGGSMMSSLVLKENKNTLQSIMNQSVISRGGKLTRDEEKKLAKQPKVPGKLLYQDFVKVILDF